LFCILLTAKATNGIFMTYQQQLSPWVINKVLPDLQQSVVYRCRRRHEAESYLKVLVRHQPDAQFQIGFEMAGREEKVADTALASV
jgi:hypothetical protein